MTISVGAVGGDERHAYYSTAGASLFISAPGGDVDDDKRHFTARVGGGCQSASVGTSFATPVVSGVVAMMLEVNPSLGWRDVQGVLAQSARPITNDPSDDSATINGAGMWVSNRYGFGIVDAAAAVELSKTWINYGEEKLIAVDSGVVDIPIYDNVLMEVVSSITITPADVTTTSQRQNSAGFVVEAVEVLLDISHFSRGDLDIRLQSPSGTESILHPGLLPENSQLGSDQSWKLMTIRNWGESPYGEWKLKVVDEKAGAFGTCVDVAGYFFLYSDDTVVTCSYIEKAAICVNGDYNANFFNSGNYESLKTLSDDDGKTMKEACCMCGGGLGRDAFEDSLHHWTIAIYGREDSTRPNVKTASPSSNTTEVPSMSPSAEPTKLPTSQPTTQLPTASPSSLPTTLPTAVPTTSPSPTWFPTMIQSDEPSQFPSFDVASIHPSRISTSTLTPNGSGKFTPMPRPSLNPTLGLVSPSPSLDVFNGPSPSPSNASDIEGWGNSGSKTGIGDTPDPNNATASIGNDLGGDSNTKSPSFNQSQSTASPNPTPVMATSQPGSASIRGSSNNSSGCSSLMATWSILFAILCGLWLG